jgi:hypothetical protein
LEALKFSQWDARPKILTSTEKEVPVPLSEDHFGNHLQVMAEIRKVRKKERHTEIKRKNQSKETERENGNGNEGKNKRDRQRKEETNHALSSVIGFFFVSNPFRHMFMCLPEGGGGCRRKETNEKY